MLDDNNGSADNWRELSQLTLRCLTATHCCLGLTAGCNWTRPKSSHQWGVRYKDGLFSIRLERWSVTFNKVETLAYCYLFVDGTRRCGGEERPTSFKSQLSSLSICCNNDGLRSVT